MVELLGHKHLLSCLDTRSYDITLLHTLLIAYKNQWPANWTLLEMPSLMNLRQEAESQRAEWVSLMGTH